MIKKLLETTEDGNERVKDQVNEPVHPQNAERVRCDRCGVEWTYCGYPAYPGCPVCGSRFRSPVMHKAKCPHCGGIGDVLTNEVYEPLYVGCETNNDAVRISNEILKRDREKIRTMKRLLCEECGKQKLLYCKLYEGKRLCKEGWKDKGVDVDAE